MKNIQRLKIIKKTGLVMEEAYETQPTKLKTSPKKVRSIIDLTAGKAQLLDNCGVNKVLKQSWEKAVKDYNLPLYTYTSVLLSQGVTEDTVTKLNDLLLNLKIDVSDPHASSSELSVIIGYLSKELLNEDLSSYRRTVDEIECDYEIDTKEPLCKIPKTKYTYSRNFERTYESISELRRWERFYILSNNYYSDISRTLLRENNTFVRKVLRNELKRIWGRLKIPKSAKAVLYFRDLKTYAGDLDLFYWGPKREAVLIELSRILMPLGYKIDHRSTSLVESIIEGKLGLKNVYLSTYLYMYFFMGRTIEINGDSFVKHYKENGLPALSLVVAWPSLYMWSLEMCDELESVYSTSRKQYPGFKDLSFRLLTAVLMGLSINYNIPFILDVEVFLDRLRPFVAKGKIKILRAAFYGISQIRNLYQLTTNRRWEMVYPECASIINRLLKKQGCESIHELMTRYAATFRDLLINCTKHPQPTDNTEGPSDYQTEAKNIVWDSYEMVVKIYLSLIQKSSYTDL